MTFSQAEILVCIRLNSLNEDFRNQQILNILNSVIIRCYCLSDIHQQHLLFVNNMLNHKFPSDALTPIQAPYLFIIKQVPVAAWPMYIHVNMITNKIVCISCIMHDTKISTVADSNENKSSNTSTILTFSLDRFFNRKMCFIYFSSFLAK